MPNKYTEEEIIAGLKNDDDRIFNDLYEEFSAPLYYFCTSLSQDPEESKDIVSTTFNTLWNLRKNFESLANIKAFLYITAKNRCFDFLRYRHRQAEGRKEITSHLILAEQQEDVERLIIESDFLNRVYNEIQQLPPQCKEIFILTYFNELTSGEIATRLGISVSTVTTQRSRAIKFLRDVLRDENQLLMIMTLGVLTGVEGSKPM
jgi:RNA polymerase sigma-70 factor (ECF subfamily)